MDGCCLANTEGDKDCKGQASMLVPASALKLLAAISHDSDVYELGITGKDGKNIVFYDGTLLFSARLMEGKIIEAQKVFGAFKPHCLVQVKAAELKNGLSCMETISSGGRVGIRLVPDGMELQSLDENRPGRVVIAASVSKPMDRSFFLEISHLVNCLRQLSGEVALNFSTDGNLMITDGSMRYFQPGMRAPRKAAAKAGSSKSNIAA